MDWAKAVESRDQLVLFPHRLDEAIGPDHRVRVLDEVLCRMSWTKWESSYDLRRGQPPIHPRILAGVILYGLLVRIRSSRALEEALQVRLDFRWLAEGRSIDHTTLSEFRRKHPDALRDLFVQTGLVARQIGCLPLETLAFDGTRVRSNNRRSGSRTPGELRELKKELVSKFEELVSQINAADQTEDERFGTSGTLALSVELADVSRRQRQIASALAELDRIQREGEEAPKRLPITDPQSRLMPNKDGGFAPNYTPTATVDVDSGLIVSADVLSDINEDHQLVSAVEDVQKLYGLETPPSVLADGLMATGDNLATCQAKGIELFSPVQTENIPNNPALRDDLSQPVAVADRDRLPTKPLTRGGKKTQQLDKAAFVYDNDLNCYWCPEGKRLNYHNTTTERTTRGAVRVRDRYVASAEDCVGCPLKPLCVSGQAKSRSINREQHESLRQAHAIKMSMPQAKATYARRAPVNERPFAVIKHQFGVRQFLLRGTAKVKQEWHWLTAAYNLLRLISLLPEGTGPPAGSTCEFSPSL